MASVVCAIDGSNTRIRGSEDKIYREQGAQIDFGATTYLVKVHRTGSWKEQAMDLDGTLGFGEDFSGDATFLGE